MWLIDYHSTYAAEIVSWVTSTQEAEAWSSYVGKELPPPTIFASWHRDPDVHPFVLLRDNAPLAYGELWVDLAAREIELARLLVAPAVRNQGIGRALVTLLCDQATTFGIDQIYMRVRPDNHAALACYTGAEFVRVSAAEEAEFNQGQPILYTWLHHQ